MNKDLEDGLVYIIEYLDHMSRYTSDVHKDVLLSSILDMSLRIVEVKCDGVSYVYTRLKPISYIFLRGNMKTVVKTFNRMIDDIPNTDELYLRRWKERINKYWIEMRRPPEFTPIPMNNQDLLLPLLNIAPILINITSYLHLDDLENLYRAYGSNFRGEVWDMIILRAQKKFNDYHIYVSF